MPKVANAQTLLLDIKATDFNPNTDVLTPSVVPNGTFGMTLDGPAPILVPGATQNGSPSLQFGGSTGFDFNQVVGGTNGGVGATILAYVLPNPATAQPGTLVAAGGGSIDYRMSQTGNPDSTGDRQDLLAAQQTDWGTSNTALSTTAFNIIDVTVPAGAGTASFRLNGAADGSVSVSRGEFGISRFGAAQLNNAGGDQEQFSGQIVELQYWSGVLSASQIQAVEAQFTTSYFTALPATNLTWTGANSNNLWDTTAADNFAGPTGTATQFVNTTDTATFADFVPGTLATVTNGTVVIQNGGVIPASVTVTSSSVNYTFSDNDGTNGILGATGINKSGGSTLTLAGSNSFTGPVTIGNGVVALATNGALGTSSGITVNGGDLYLQPGITIPSTIPLTLNSGSNSSDALTFNQSSASSTLTYSAPITLAATSQIGVVTGNLTLASNMSGAGGLALNTPGLITLSGSNTYAGDTYINGGNVTLTGTINASNVSNAGSLHVAPNSFSIARFVISGGTANFNGAGSDIAIGYFATGALEIDSGTLYIAQSIQVGPNLFAYGEFLANAGVTKIGGTLAVGGPYGTGVVTLSPGSTVTASGLAGVGLGGGPTSAGYISTGILNLNGGTLLTTNVQGVPLGGHLNFNGGTLKASGSTPALISNLQSAYVYGGGAIVDDGGNTVTIPQSLSTPDGSGVTSVPVLAAGTGYTSQPIVQITGGTLTPNGSQATAVAVYNASIGQVTGITITSPGNYSSTSGLTASFTGGNGVAPSLDTFGTATNVGGGFTKLGSGTVTLTGSNTYSGPTKIIAGKLQVGTVGTPVTIQNPSFEANSAGPNGYTYYNNTGSTPGTDGAWNYNSAGGSPSGAGITNGGGFAFNGAPPDGTQAAFIQENGFLQQSINFPAAGTYTLNFYDAQRANGGNSTLQMLDVQVGSTDLTPGGFTPTGDWSLTTLVFSVAAAGSQNLTFQGIDPAVLDNTAFVDDVSLNQYTFGGTANSIPATSPVVLSSTTTLDVNGYIQAIGSLTGPSGSFVTLGNANVGSGTLVTGGDGTNTTFAGAIMGLGGITKVGTGVQTLSGSNSYSGPTNVSGGTLIIGAAGALPAGNAVSVGLAALLVTDSQATLSSVSSMNLNGNLIVHNGNLKTITTSVAAGYNNGAWNGSGAAVIASSAAAGDTTHLTALGVIQNSTNGSPTGTALYPTFEGQPVTDTDVLVKYTYYGDTNLDGKVDGTDYSRIDVGFMSQGTANPLTGWFNGDFNYDGVIDGSDYTLIDNAFNTQGAQFTAQLATATAQVAGTAAVPEPAALSLLAIGATGLLGRRRHAHSDRPQ